MLDTHAWLAVIGGRKRVALHPPAVVDDYDALRVDALAVLGGAAVTGVGAMSNWRPATCC